MQAMVETLVPPLGWRQFPHHFGSGHVALNTCWHIRLEVQDSKFDPQRFRRFFCCNNLHSGARGRGKECAAMKPKAQPD